MEETGKRGDYYYNKNMFVTLIVYFDLLPLSNDYSWRSGTLRTIQSFLIDLFVFVPLYGSSVRYG